MCWNIFFLFILWRITRWVLRGIAHVLILFPIISVHVFRLSNQQALLAHRPRDASLDSLLGWLIAMGLLSFAAFSSDLWRSISLILSFSVLLVLFSGHFRPLGIFSFRPPAFRSPESLRVYTIKTMPEETWNKDKALALIRQLLDVAPDVILSIEADAMGIYWRVIDSVKGRQEELIRGVLYSVYPETDIKISGLGEWIDYPNHHRQSLFFEQEKSFALPLQNIERTLDLDPLVILSQIGNDLQAGEKLSFVLALGGFAAIAEREGRRESSRNARSPLLLFSFPNAVRHLQELLQGEERLGRDKEFDMRLVEEKLRSPMFYASLWLEIHAPERDRLAYLSQLAQSFVQSRSFTPNNLLRLSHQVRGVEGRQSDILQHYQAWRLGRGRHFPKTIVLNHAEIASLWHLPHTALVASRIQRIPQWKDIPEEMANQHEGNILGEARSHRKWVEARIELEMRRRHINIIGQTGVGKSTLMYHQITQDIDNGYGVAVIDPHGALVNYLLLSGILDERAHDVVVIDMKDIEHPIPLNPFALRQSEEGVLRVISIIESLFSGTEQAVQTSSFLRAGLLLLSHQTDVTMKDLAYLFLDESYRKSLLAQTKREDILLYMQKQYDKVSQSAQSNISNPILNRVRPFYSNPHLYPMVCHPDCLNFEELMRKDKIILVSLHTDSEQVPLQERNLLGTLIMSQLQLSGMRQPAEKPFFIYVDEVQHFVTSSLDIIYAEARKNGLALISANQYMGQLKGQSKEAMLGNAGTNIIFRLGPEDAPSLSSRTKPEFNDHHLQNLDAHTAVVKTQYQKRTQAAFTLRTLPLPALPDNAKAKADAIRRLSRSQYSPKTRLELLTWLEERYQTPLEDLTFIDD